MSRVLRNKQWALRGMLSTRETLRAVDVDGDLGVFDLLAGFLRVREGGGAATETLPAPLRLPPREKLRAALRPVTPGTAVRFYVRNESPGSCTLRCGDGGTPDGDMTVQAGATGQFCLCCEDGEARYRVFRLDGSGKGDSAETEAAEKEPPVSHACSILGGEGNRVIASPWSFIGGGHSNDIVGCSSAAICGGFDNDIGGRFRAPALGNAILGGAENCIDARQALVGAEGDAAPPAPLSVSYATIVGGLGNSVAADYGIACGEDAHALHRNSFVFNGSTERAESQAEGSFCVAAPGGLRLGRGTLLHFGAAAVPAASLDGRLSATPAAYAPVQWSDSADGLTKTGYVPIFVDSAGAPGPR